MVCKGSRRANCNEDKSCLYTRTSDKRKSYCRRSRTSKRTGTASICRGTSQTNCIGNGCVLAMGKKRSYCRKPKNKRKTK